MSSIIKFAKGFQLIFSNDPAKRRRVRHECARIAASIFGDFPLSEDQKLWRDDKEFLEIYKKFSPSNPYSQDRKYTLREYTRSVRDLSGAFAECGCYQGASAYFIALEEPTTALHLFDSFEGLSEPSKEDGTKDPEHKIWEKGSLSTGEEIVAANLNAFHNIHIHKGWIPNKFADVENVTFKLVHIDVDLYQPTLDSLKFFYPRLQSGGVIVLDDYGFLTCPGAYKAANEYIKNTQDKIIHLPTGQGIIVKLSPLL